MENSYRVIDLFAGAGGFSLGFKLANFKVDISLEIDEWAVDTLNANNHDQDTTILQADIRHYNLLEIKQLLKTPPDVIIGGPPCQGFSLAGSAKDPNDPRNSLFMEFAKWVDFFQPSVFVMENVTGLLHRKNSTGQNVINIIVETFSSLGYYVEVWNLNAAEYGVPQIRNRVFIVGNKFKKLIGKPLPTHYLSQKKKPNDLNLSPAITVYEAIGDLPEIEAGQGQGIMKYDKKAFNNYQISMRQQSSFVFNHEAMNHTKRMIKRYETIQKGILFDDLPEELKVKKRNGSGSSSDVKYQSNYRLLKANMISYTIPASFYSNFIHPFSPRNITSREAARIQSFPDWYIFKGKRTQISSKLLHRLGKQAEDNLSQYNQIGNAVPPLLAKAIADRINTFLIKSQQKGKVKRNSQVHSLLQ